MHLITYVFDAPEKQQQITSYLKSFFGFSVDGEDDGYRLVDRFLSIEKYTEMLALQELTFTHESLQWGCPSF